MTLAEQQTKARIYLSGKRGVTHAKGYKSFHTFSTNEFPVVSRESFKGIHALNDELLHAQAAVRHVMENDCMVLLLPIVGGISFRTGEDEFRFLEADTCQLIVVPEDSILEVRNPYLQEPINYLILSFPTDTAKTSFEQFSLFNLQARKNKLTEIFTTSKTNGFLGQFSGRTDQTLTLSDKSTGAFVFVIEGAFEVENRLLENRDGLALWNTKTIEFEALSNNAIILIVELI